MEKQEVVRVMIPPMEREEFVVNIIGTSPLISHRFSDKAKKAILDKQMKVAKAGRAIKNPLDDFVESLYYLNGADPIELLEKLKSEGCEIGSDVSAIYKDVPIGFPAAGFKKAAVSACRNIDAIKMTMARGAFFIKEDAAGYVEIKYDKLMVREDTVTVGRGSDMRYRGCLVGWSAKLKIESNPLVMSKEQICNLIGISGFGVGVGDWRPEKNGAYGMFKLA